MVDCVILKIEWRIPGFDLVILLWYEGNEIGKQDVQISLTYFLNSKCEVNLPPWWNSKLESILIFWERTNFFNKHFHRTSTKVPERLLGTIYFLHNLIAWSMQYALQTFYLGKVNFLSVTDVSPGITWIETRKIGNCKRVDKRKQRSDTTRWQKG